MRLRWLDLMSTDRMKFRVAQQFLKERLCEPATVRWALSAGEGDAALRAAVLDAIDRKGYGALSPLWRETWALIEESWRSLRRVRHDGDGAFFALVRRLEDGDRSLSIANDIANHVSPWLRVENHDALALHFRKPPKIPRKLSDLFSVSLGSVDVIDPQKLQLHTIDNAPLLEHLASCLDCVVSRGLAIAERIGWDPIRSPWKLGPLHRVYYVASEEEPNESDPDQYSEGLAPAVKLLYACVARLAELDFEKAKSWARRWRSMQSPIYQRLWAAIARNAHLIQIGDVEEMLAAIPRSVFFDTDKLPEFLELRARRFGEMSLAYRAVLAKRLRQGPPLTNWARGNRPRVEGYQRYQATRELRRIEIAGGLLPRGESTWLHKNIANYPDLIEMATLDAGFYVRSQVRTVGYVTDTTFGDLHGVARLNALNGALASSQESWNDDPAGQARAWINSSDNSAKVLEDFEEAFDAGTEMPILWDALTSYHTPKKGDGNEVLEANHSAARRMLSLLSRLPLKTVEGAVEGIAQWISWWEQTLKNEPDAIAFWGRIWPIAARVTNERAERRAPEELVVRPSPKQVRDPYEFDTLNSPAGKLVGFFFNALPSAEADRSPFADGGIWVDMRDALLAQGGRSALIAKYRILEQALPYFLRVDPGWTRAMLLDPLNSGDDAARPLWRAIGQRTQFDDVLRYVGAAMAEKALDLSLPRSTRRMFVFSLVVERLRAFLSGRDPVVASEHIAQMLRSLDDEVRAAAAETVQTFVAGNLRVDGDVAEVVTTEVLFERCVAPFLSRVWPQERTLVTPGTSKAWADLPVTLGEYFSVTAALIERFIMPFDCWSMMDYGFRGESDAPNMDLIDSPESARALLTLLELTISPLDGAVVPYGLSPVLEHLARQSPELAVTSSFRRLEAQSRRQ